MQVVTPGAYPISRRLALFGSLGLLAGCAARAVVLDRSAMTGIKQVALPTPGFPGTPDVYVLSGIANSYSLIGMAVRANRSNELVALMQAKGFDPRAVFLAELEARVQALRLTPLDVAANPNRSGFVESYPGPDSDDAALDVFVSQYGFYALSPSDDTPFRPGVSVGMRLVSARDRSILMQDKVFNTGVDAPVAGLTGSPGVVPASFVNFSDITANPDLTLQSLRLGLSYAAQTVAARLA